jgi:hypothetical protein
MLTKFRNAQRRCVQDACTEFHPSRKMNVEIIVKLIHAAFTVQIFMKIRNYTMTLRGDLLNRIIPQTDQ